MQKQWWLLGVLAVLPFVLVACGDDDDDDTSDEIQERAGDVAETAERAVDEAQSAVAGIAPIQVDLEEVGGSGVSGNAIITPEGSDKARVSFEIDSEGYRAPGGDDDDDDDFEAGIWEGDCAAISGRPAFDLGDLDDDVSTATADTGIEELKDGQYVIALVGDDFDDDDDDDDSVDDNRVLACGTIE